MSEAKLASLLKKLHQATRSHRLKWRHLEREGQYETVFSEYSVRITERRISKKDFEPVLLICDKQGGTMEEISELRFARPQPATEMGTYLKEIYNFAVRQSASVDEAIDSILGEL